MITITEALRNYMALRVDKHPHLDTKKSKLANKNLFVPVIKFFDKILIIIYFKQKKCENNIIFSIRYFSLLRLQICL